MNEYENRGFCCGVALIVAILARSNVGFGEPNKAAMLLDESGLRLSDFIAAGVEDYDLDVLRELYRTEPSLKEPRS